MSRMQNVPIIDISRFLDGGDKKDIVAGRCRKALARRHAETSREQLSGSTIRTKPRRLWLCQRRHFA
jgi:hypothetical protein